MALVTLIARGDATATEAKYTLSANSQFIGSVLRQLQDVRRIVCAASCREYMDCGGFHAGPDNSCQLLGPGYVIDDPAGYNYYISNELGKYQVPVTVRPLNIIRH
jgi:hypothetical protein